MSKKIIYIGGFELPDKNAAAHRVMSNAKLLREMGHEVLFFSISKSLYYGPCKVEGFNNNCIQYPFSLKQWIYYILFFVSNKEIIDKKPDYVILYNFPAVASLKIMRSCHKHGIKVIHDLTEWESETGWSLRSIIRRFDINLRMKYCTKRMDGVIAISKYLYNYYRKYTTTIFIPPTVDLQASKWNRERKIIVGNKIKLVYAGCAGKGQKDRLDIIINDVIRYPQLQLDIIGMTEDNYILYFGYLPKHRENVIFHGHLSHIDALQIVQMADFQMIIREGNLKNNAGFPTKFVESISCCTPVVSTLTSNIADYLVNGLNGFIVTNENPLGEVLRVIAEMSKEKIKEMKMECKRCNQFDYRVYKKSFEILFK